MKDKKKSDRLLLQFAVITDTHVRLPNTVEEGGYKSNRLVIDRTRYVVQCINRLKPDFIIHLGDIVHPIPSMSNHEVAVQKASEIFSEIEAPFYVLPGNHDIGDKPNAWLPAPVVEEDSHRIFLKHWGALFYSFSTKASHNICLDTPVMNTGLEREYKQRAWLENELLYAKEKELRVFVFMHYPLFICDPVEPPHYDNVDEPARSDILGLFKKFGIEAVFSGHVHNGFISIHENTIYYSVPSTAFVRPEYSELATVAPGDEFGRNDSAKLGFFLVRIYENRHEVLPVRTYGAGQLDIGLPQVEPYRMLGQTSRMMGVSLRRGWGRRVELAADGLDEFQRKEANRDGLLLALLELGVTDLRVPFADLANADVRQRLSDFRRLGFAFTVYSISVPGEEILAIMEMHGNLIANWEMIFPEQEIPQIKNVIQRVKNVFSGQLFIAPVVPLKEKTDSKIFQHFVSHGFSSRELDKVERWMAMLDNCGENIGLTFRVSPWDEPIETLHEIEKQNKWVKLVNLQLPRLDEGVRFEDDSILQSFIVDAYKASLKMSNTIIFIDTFMDSDRGYYPRNGLLDRRYNPRPAFYALKLASLQN